MRFNILLLFIVTTQFAGCDTLNYRQYRIQAGSNVADTAKVKSVLQSVAGQLGLEDKTALSLTHETVAFYKESKDNFALGIGARYYQEDILVDVYNGFGPKTTAYNEANRLLIPALTSEFGSRFSTSKVYIPIKPSNIADKEDLDKK